MKLLLFLISFNLFAASEFTIKSEAIKTKVAALEIVKNEYCQAKEEAKRKECDESIEMIIKQKEQIEKQNLVDQEWSK